MAPAPIVTGLSPKEGPPGTRIIIRGEDFGTNPSDLIGISVKKKFNYNYSWLF